MNKDIAVLITDNMESESNALTRYIPLLNALVESGDKDAADAVREIMSDEKNHQNVLQVLLIKYDGAIPISKDNMEKAFELLKKNIK